MTLAPQEEMYFNILDAKGRLKRSKEYPYKQDVKLPCLKYMKNEGNGNIERLESDKIREKQSQKD